MVAYKDPEKKREYNKKWNKKNKERKREINKKWYEENKEGMRKWYQENKAKVLLTQKNYREKNRKKICNQKRIYYSLKENRANHLIGSARSRARKTGVKFNLNTKWLLDKLEGKCEITGLSFSFRPPRKNYVSNPMSPSLERIKPKGGYTKGNVKVVVWAVNICKWEWTVKDFKKIIKAIYKGLKNYE